MVIVLTLKNCETGFPKQLNHFTLPPAAHEGSNFSSSSPKLVMCIFDDCNNHPSG